MDAHTLNNLEIRDNEIETLIKMNQKEKVYETEFESIPKPTTGGFSLLKIDDIAIPHPYCITPLHLKYSNGILDAAAIERAEEKGAVCDICKQANRRDGTRILKYHEHETVKTLFVAVDQNKDLNKVEGLVAYLNEIKEVCESLNIKGFAFPVYNYNSENTTV